MKYLGLFIAFCIDFLCVVFTIGQFNPHCVNRLSTWIAIREYNEEKNG